METLGGREEDVPILEIQTEKIDLAGGEQDVPILEIQTEKIGGGGTGSSIELFSDDHPRGREPEEDVELHTIDQDVFSLMFISPVLSKAFMYSFFVFGVQISILALTLVNLLLNGTKENPLNIPPYTQMEEISAQGVAILVSVFLNRDVTNSFYMFQVAYNDDIRNILPSAKKWKFVLANALRFIEGLLSLLVTFLLIVATTDVLDIFFNFTALQFVSELDDIGFYIADMGYLFFNIQDMTRAAKNVQMEYQSRLTFFGSKYKLKGETLKTGLLCFFMIVLYGYWTYIIRRQMHGFNYTTECQQFQVNFEDKSYDFFDHMCPDLDGTSKECAKMWASRSDPIRYLSFSDTYYAASSDNGGLILKNNRPIYYQRQAVPIEFGTPDNPGPQGRIFYCKEVGAWVFGIE